MVPRVGDIGPKIGFVSQSRPLSLFKLDCIFTSQSFCQGAFAIPIGSSNLKCVYIQFYFSPLNSPYELYRYNNQDNGFCRFNHVRIPRANMAMRHAQLSKDGVYSVKSKANKRAASYSTMTLVRGYIVQVRE